MPLNIAMICAVQQLMENQPMNVFYCAKSTSILHNDFILLHAIKAKICIPKKWWE